jgi:hypothetical protein
MYAQCDAEYRQYNLMEGIFTTRQMAMLFTVMIFTSSMEATIK